MQASDSVDTRMFLFLFSVLFVFCGTLLKLFSKPFGLLFLFHLIWVFCWLNVQQSELCFLFSLQCRGGGEELYLWVFVNNLQWFGSTLRWPEHALMSLLPPQITLVWERAWLLCLCGLCGRRGVWVCPPLRLGALRPPAETPLSDPWVWSCKKEQKPCLQSGRGLHYELETPPGWATEGLQPLLASLAGFSINGKIASVRSGCASSTPWFPIRSDDESGIYIKLWVIGMAVKGKNHNDWWPHPEEGGKGWRGWGRGLTPEELHRWMWIWCGDEFCLVCVVTFYTDSSCWLIAIVARETGGPQNPSPSLRLRGLDIFAWAVWTNGRCTLSYPRGNHICAGPQLFPDMFSDFFCFSHGVASRSSVLP